MNDKPKVVVLSGPLVDRSGVEAALRREGHDVQVIQPAPIVVPVAGADRNKPCPCGSGKKAKRCEHTVTPAPYEVRRHSRMSALAAMAIASLVSVPGRRR